jgi:hypothetical protein
MASLVNKDLKIPYEIGVFIASQVPSLDSISNGSPWAAHRDFFKDGPNSFFYQMKQGLILEVRNHNHKPESIHTKYGKWTVLSGSSGSFDKVFAVVQEKLNLRKIEKFSNTDISYYAIQSWDGQVLEEPIQANEKAGEGISRKEVAAAYQEFKPFMSACYQ